MKNSKKSEKGFTLMEIVISVAVVSLISWFILQIFVVSANANMKAQNIDIASSKAQEVIELIKSSGFDDITSLELFQSADPDMSVTRPDHSGYWYGLWYDKNWEFSPSAGYEGDRFLMIADIQPDERQRDESAVSDFSSATGEITHETCGRLIKISVFVYDVSLSEDKQLLVTYETAKYFDDWGRGAND